MIIFKSFNKNNGEEMLQTIISDKCEKNVLNINANSEEKAMTTET